MNEIINKFLIAGDKFMPEMHLRQSGLTCSACGPFTKNKGRIQTVKNKTCFQHDIDYGVFKNLLRRTVSDKLL